MVIGLKDVIDKVNALEMEFTFGEMVHINVLKEFSRVIYHLKRDNYQWEKDQLLKDSLVVYKISTLLIVSLKRNSTN